MYSRKSVGPRMESWGSPTLTGYSNEDVPSKTTRSRLLLKKVEIRLNTRPEIRYDLSLWRRPTCQHLTKCSGISSATAWVVPDLIKSIAILSGTSVRRSAVDRKRLQVFQRHSIKTSKAAER